MTYPAFAVSAPGMEAITAQEIAELGLTPRQIRGGVELDVSQTDLYRVNLLLRTASRVLVRLGAFYARSFSELRKAARKLTWEQYLRPGQPVALRVTCRKSKLYHSDAVAERVMGAIADRLGAPSPLVASRDKAAEQPEQLVVVRLHQNQCTISADSSGANLHRRGYRLATAKAPLRETLAAGMLLAAGWDGRTPLLDPFCGSGTIPIEAALLARNIAPGKGRRFAFMAWPNFAEGVWDELMAAALAAERADAPPLLASDRDAGAIQAAETNAARAGVGDAIDFTCQAVSALTPPPGPGHVITNPPYGVRVRSNRDLRNLYAQFGNVLREHCPGWRVTFLCNDPALIGQTGLDVETTHNWRNGGRRVQVAQAVVDS